MVSEYISWPRTFLLIVLFGIDPFIVNEEEEPGFVLVDVEYNSKGYRALYEYRVQDGNFCLAQD